jgi:CRISPR-associated exonuclease Cas4
METLVMLSALSHFVYCPRRCALVHLESVWEENLFTLKGTAAHERADSGKATWKNGVKEVRGLPLFSDILGLVGKADVVEFSAEGKITPVEYKHGTRKPGIHDDIQLCAQGLCLEEMLGKSVTSGAIYSIQTKRRREVPFDDELREATHQVIADVRALLESEGKLPPALTERAKCRNCSLFDACVPDTLFAARAAWHARNLFHLEAL